MRTGIHRKRWRTSFIEQVFSTPKFRWNPRNLKTASVLMKVKYTDCYACGSLCERCALATRFSPSASWPKFVAQTRVPCSFWHEGGQAALFLDDKVRGTQSSCTEFWPLLSYDCFLSSDCMRAFCRKTSPRSRTESVLWKSHCSTDLISIKTKISLWSKL